MTTTAKVVIEGKDKSKKAFESVKRNFAGVKGLAVRIGGVVAGVGAIFTATAGTVLALAKRSAEFADEVGKASQKIGTTSERLSGLAYAAELNAVSFEQLQTGMAKAAKTAEDFVNKSKTAVDAYGKLDIDPTQFSDTSDLFEEIAEKLSKLDNGARKTAIAQELLGRSGKDLIPLLNAGRDGIRELTAEAEKFGLIVDRDTVAASVEFNDNLTRMKGAVRGLTIEFGNRLIPDFAEITAEMVRATKQGGILRGVLASIGSAFDLAVNGTQFEQRAERIRELSQFLSKQGKVLNNASPKTNKGVLDNLRKKVAAAKAELKELVTIQSKEIDKRNSSVGNSRQPSVKPISIPTVGRGSASKRIDKVSKALESLRVKASEIGKTENQLEIFRLKTLGASDAQITLAQSYLDTINTINSQQDAAKRGVEITNQNKTATDLYNETQRELLDLLNRGAISGEVYAKSLNKAYSELLGADEKLQRLNGLLSQTPTAKLELSRDLMRDLYEALENGAINAEQFQEAVDVALGRTVDLVGPANDTFDEFGKQAARNIQDSFADFLFRPFDKGLKGMVESFENTVQRMIAEATAARITKKLFGDLAGGDGDGLLGGVFKNIFDPIFSAKGNAFDGKGVTAFAKGGVVNGATPFAYGGGDRLGVMGEKGPEAIVPLKRGSDGSLGIAVNGRDTQQQPIINMVVNTPDANSFNLSRGQIVTDLQRQLNFANRNL